MNSAARGRRRRGRASRRSAFDLAELVYDLVVHRRRPVSSRIVAQHLEVLGPGARVLDLGAGSGRIALDVEALAGVRVTACDVDLAAMLEAREAPSGGAVAADGQALPFADGGFAGVYLVYVLHHVSDQLRLLVEVRRVLSDDGRLVVVEFDGTSRLVTLFRILARLTRRRCWFHSAESLAELLQKAGVAVEIRRIDRATVVAVASRGSSAARSGTA